MLVDAAVVVVENIINHLANKREHIPHLHVIYRAVKEVITPVAAGVAIIVIVFLPLLTLQGLEGKLFTPVALTIVFALAASLLISLSAVPMLASFLLKHADHHEQDQGADQHHRADRQVPPRQRSRRRSEDNPRSRGNPQKAVKRPVIRRGHLPSPFL